MASLAKRRGVTPEAVIADSWYSSLDNLKHIRNLGWNWVMGLRKNRAVNRNQKLEELTIPDEGLDIHLRGYGWIHVFRFVGTNGRTDYIGTNIENPTRKQIKTLVRKRWEIEVFHPRAQTGLWSGALSVTHGTSAEKSYCAFGIELDQSSRCTKER
jgi:hypothetical protein